MKSRFVLVFNGDTKRFVRIYEVQTGKQRGVSSYLYRDGYYKKFVKYQLEERVRVQFE